ARRKAEAERKRKAAEEARRKAEAERKRKAAEEARRKAEAERLRRLKEQEEAALRTAEAKRRAQRLAGLRQQYVAQIRTHVERAWRRPPGVQSADRCVVEVRQTPEGRVTEVRTLECHGDEAFRRSVEDAVWRADPLPPAPDPAVFDRIIQFEFIPQ
ncbi:MAG TPA: cell envelope integrity protein TolA, partial [Acidobacteria bacterium]|nr:cell envelope integrity protein TolA [Acidobacteriota bacterium]